MNSGQKHFIAIGQAKASGKSELLSIGAELVNIGQHVDSLAMFTRINGEESYISRVVEELGKNEWVHFACHGLPDVSYPELYLNPQGTPESFPMTCTEPVPCKVRHYTRMSELPPTPHKWNPPTQKG